MQKPRRVVDVLARAVVTLPGAAGASMVAYGTADLTHRTAAGLLVGGVFCLLVDWRLR